MRSGREEQGLHRGHAAGQLEAGDRGRRDRCRPPRAVLPQEVPAEPRIPPRLHRTISFSSLGLPYLLVINDESALDLISVGNCVELLFVVVDP